MSLRTPLGRVRGLGAAKEGVSHWWLQRVTAVALVPLTLWFVAALISVMGEGYGAMVAWLSSPFSAGIMLLLIFAVFFHGYLGLQVVIEDYVHHEGRKVALLLAVKFLSFLLGAACAISIIKIAAGG